MDSQQKIDAALEFIRSFGMTNGAHHKQWILDQLVMILTGDDYDIWVKKHNGKIDSDGETEYMWDIGIPP